MVYGGNKYWYIFEMNNRSYGENLTYFSIDELSRNNY